MLTLAESASGSAEEKKRRARDIYLLALNPYFLMRTIVLFFGGCRPGGLAVHQGAHRMCSRGSIGCTKAIR